MEKVTVNLVDKALSSMEAASALEGLSKTDVINRALQMYVWILEHQTLGYKFCVIDEKNNVELVEFK